MEKVTAISNKERRSIKILSNTYLKKQLNNTKKKMTVLINLYS